MALFLFTSPVYAGFFLQYALNYHSETDSGDAAEFSFSKMNNTVFLAASMDLAGQFIIGQNISSWNKSYKSGDADEIKMNLLDMGPKLLMYFSQTRTWFASAGWNFYSKGKGTVNGEDATIQGTSTNFGLGYHTRISKHFGMGASLNYIANTITTQTIDSTETEVTSTYTTIMPMLEFALRY